VVVLNAGDKPIRFNFQIPGLAGSVAEQVSWSGCEWREALAPKTLLGETLGVDLSAREGAVVKAARVP
jgi:hypothetical protein